MENNLKNEATEYEFAKVTSTVGNELIGQYVICRCNDSGVHAGILESRNGTEAMLKDSRWLWYWSGANSVEDVAVNGLDPKSSKIPAQVPSKLLLDVRLIMPCTEKAKQSILSVPLGSQ